MVPGLVNKEKLRMLRFEKKKLNGNLLAFFRANHLLLTVDSFPLTYMG